MAYHQVHIEWGHFMSSCYISLKNENGYGPMLHIADDITSDKRVKPTEVVPGLTGYDQKDLSLEEILPLLPNKNSISWEDGLKGDAFMGYELRGKGDGYRVWIQGTFGGDKDELNHIQKEDLLKILIEARSLFFP